MRVGEIKRNSLDDGPGIRSVVFFKGCPLRCVWCQNPEAISPAPQLQRLPERCLGCRACVEVCPEGVAGPGGPPADRCRACGRCVDACPAGARRIVGTDMDAAELAERLLRDEPFYRASGGGVTLSGGEPTRQPEPAGELAQRLAERGVHVLLETCGLYAPEPFERHLLPYLSEIYFDLKLADPELHRRYTGQSNRRILANLERLVERGRPPVLPRVPLIPGITAEPANLEALAELLVALGLPEVALLPYNPLWRPKRLALGLDLPYDHDAWMPADEIERCREVFRCVGLEVG